MCWKSIYLKILNSTKLTNTAEKAMVCLFSPILATMVVNNLPNSHQGKQSCCGEEASLPERADGVP
jgi:hypothetical protein